MCSTDVSTDGPIVRITLTNSAQRNPLSLETMREIRRGLEEIGEDSSIRVIVIQANGPAFSAGHDLNELVGRSLEDEREIFASCTEMMQAIHRVRQPVIASVQGVALAAGCQLVAACDLAVASSSARFGTPGVKIGLFCSTPMVALSRAIGRKRTLRMLLTGEMIDADTAESWGLINFVTTPDNLAETTSSLVSAVAEASASTVTIGKESFYRQIELTEDAAYFEMQETMAINATSHDAQEGITAFLGKRAPVWRDN
ncbi:enoyl-CoA hydratase [Rhodococcus sp. NPDC060176]|uniref:enoyl-CoA hydratase n=1 Tax=Rhodococcus sp. NPDC060176 TaxID=3347062 RepID=UPI00364EDF29